MATSIYTDNSVIILDNLLKNYPGEVTGHYPEGDWGQNRQVLSGTGSVRFILDTYTDVLYKFKNKDDKDYRDYRPNISFTLDINGPIQFKELIDAIQDSIFEHFINPLDNGASILHGVEGAFVRGKLWLGYEGIEILTDQLGPYYLVKFTD